MTWPDVTLIVSAAIAFIYGCLRVHYVNEKPRVGQAGFPLLILYLPR